MERRSRKRRYELVDLTSDDEASTPRTSADVIDHIGGVAAALTNTFSLLLRPLQPLLQANTENMAGIGLTHSITKYELRPGDHIYCYRAIGVYSHHGIYVGNSQVVHFNGDPANVQNARIARDALDTFLNGSTLRRYKYGVTDEERFLKRKGTCCRLPSDSADQVISRAFRGMDRQDEIPEYNLIRFNCEHFALYCKLGRRFANLGADFLGQIQEVLSIPFYPLKMVGFAMSALSNGAQRIDTAQEQRRIENAPVDERFINVDEINQCLQALESKSQRPSESDDDEVQILNAHTSKDPMHSNHDCEKKPAELGPEAPAVEHGAFCPSHTFSDVAYEEGCVASTQLDEEDARQTRLVVDETKEAISGKIKGTGTRPKLEICNTISFNIEMVTETDETIKTDDDTEHVTIEEHFQAPVVRCVQEKPDVATDATITTDKQYTQDVKRDSTKCIKLASMVQVTECDQMISLETAHVSTDVGKAQNCFIANTNLDKLPTGNSPPALNVPANEMKTLSGISLHKATQQRLPIENQLSILAEKARKTDTSPANTENETEKLQATTTNIQTET